MVSVGCCWLITCKLILLAHKHTIHQLSLSAPDTNSIIGEPAPHLVSSPTDTCIVFHSKQEVRVTAVAIRLKICCFRGRVSPVKWSHSPDPVSLLRSEGASCPFTQSVSPICQPSFSLFPQPHSHCATANRVPILSHTGHMSPERIYCHYRLIQREQ